MGGKGTGAYHMLKRVFKIKHGSELQREERKTRGVWQMKKEYGYQCLGNPDEVKEQWQRVYFTKQTGSLGSCHQKRNVQISDFRGGAEPLTSFKVWLSKKWLEWNGRDCHWEWGIQGLKKQGWVGQPIGRESSIRGRLNCGFSLNRERRITEMRSMVKSAVGQWSESHRNRHLLAKEWTSSLGLKGIVVIKTTREKREHWLYLLILTDVFVRGQTISIWEQSYRDSQILKTETCQGD